MTRPAISLLLALSFAFPAVMAQQVKQTQTQQETKKVVQTEVVKKEVVVKDTAG